mgnify:CR=1 FL=1
MRVLLDTKGMLVVYKPPDMAHHSEADKPGLMSALRDAQLNGDIQHPGRLYPAHRLDKHTSGAIVLAKSKDAARVLEVAFRTRNVKKLYVALSQRKPLKKQGRVRGDMVRSRRGQWMLTRGVTHPATTHFCSEPVGGRHAFVLRPTTGRTHQLRVALKSLGAPVLGDPRYAAASASRHDRMYLHSACLRLPREAALADEGEVLDVVCAPAEGRHFVSCDFVEWFGRAFGSLSLSNGVGVESSGGVESGGSVSSTWFGGTVVSVPRPSSNSFMLSECISSQASAS